MTHIVHALQIADAPLKHIMRLFAPDAPLHIKALGDTLHPSAGYVDEMLVYGVTQVGELLNFPYNFAGLVNLEATIADVAITYHDERYQLVSHLKAIKRLLAQLQAFNALPNIQPLVVLNEEQIQ